MDGVDVRKMSQHTLHSKLGYVPQKGVLFSGTIASNIAYSNDAMSDADIHKAADIAQASDFIEEKEEQYDSPIAQGGTNVSGGQKQRLSIARAIAGKPEIYIFDDSFSALDYKTDAALRKALKEETADATTIDPKHHDENADQCGDRRNELRHTLVQALLEGINIVCHPGKHLSCGTALKIF